MPVICGLLGIYLLILFARALLSWFPISYDSPVRKVRDVLDLVTEPVLRPIRNVLPPLQMGSVGLDMSFLVVVLILVIVRTALC